MEKYHPMEYVQPMEESIERIKQTREKMKEVYDLLSSYPGCREIEVALLKIEEASMWANKAIVFTQPKQQDLPMKSCRICKYYNNDKKECTRYPKWVGINNEEHWCGEYVLDADKEGKLRRDNEKIL